MDQSCILSLLNLLPFACETMEPLPCESGMVPKPPLEALDVAVWNSTYGSDIDKPQIWM